MRLLTLTTGLILLAGCSPVRESPTATRPSLPAAAASVPPARAAAAIELLPAQRPFEPVRLTRSASAGIHLVGVAFDASSARLVVADQAGGPGTRFTDAAAAGRAGGGLAAVNAGFFTPPGQPLGRVVAAGHPAGAWNTSSSLGSGVWFEDTTGHSSIQRRGAVEHAPPATLRELIQAGPLLVENHRVVAGLDALKSSIRTVILWDGGRRWWLGQASACTLAELGTTLATGQPAGWPVRHALNFDGGRSADLWVSETIAGGPLTHRLPWNRPVRNFLILVPR